MNPVLYIILCALAYAALSCLLLFLAALAAIAWTAKGESDVNGEKEADAADVVGRDSVEPLTWSVPANAEARRSLAPPTPDILTGVPTQPLSGDSRHQTVTPVGGQLSTHNQRKEK